MEIVGDRWHSGYTVVNNDCSPWNHRTPTLREYSQPIVSEATQGKIQETPEQQEQGGMIWECSSLSISKEISSWWAKPRHIHRCIYIYTYTCIDIHTDTHIYIYYIHIPVIQKGRQFWPRWADRADSVRFRLLQFDISKRFYSDVYIYMYLYEFYRKTCWQSGITCWWSRDTECARKVWKCARVASGNSQHNFLSMAFTWNTCRLRIQMIC